MSTQFKYHPGAHFMDCAKDGADHCRICGYTDASHNKATFERDCMSCEETFTTTQAANLEFCPLLH